MTSGGPAPGRDGLSYAAAGVDINAGDRAVDLMRASVAGTARPEVMGGIGGFAGLFDASRLATYRHPVLATSTDGVGTKVVLASREASNSPAKPPMPPSTSGRAVPATEARIRSTARSPALMSTPADA